MGSGKPLLRVEEMECVVRSLKGERVEALQFMVAQRNGHADVVHGLLKVAGGRWHRFFLDVGVMFWEELEALEDDDTAVAEGTSLVSVDVAGAELARIAVKPVEAGSRLTLTLVDGRAVVLQSHNEGDDHERVELLGP
jgi:hypothetical protein